MKSFRLARRSFLAAVGGAFGLRVLLDNMVASAAGATSPPRFLMTHWPLGTVRSAFKPVGEGASYTPSPILQPFIDAGLRDDMSVLYGLSYAPFESAGDSGTASMTTGRQGPGVPASGGGVAGGPSFDQIFLARANALRTASKGYVNAACHSQVDALENASWGLSYSYTKRAIDAEGGGTIDAAVPLLPELSPHQLYASLFAGFLPGGLTPANREAALRALKNRKSVLDFSLRELDRLKSLAPGSEHVKIDIHAEAIRKLELALTSPDPEYPIGVCDVPSDPDADLVGTGDTSEVLHAKVGAAHADVVIAALQCDLMRVASFQWAPATSRVAFKGMYPGAPEKSLQHYAASQLVTDPDAALADALPSGTDGELLQFLANVQTWYNTQHAAILKKLKVTKDSSGNSLLDFTVVPYLTEVAGCGQQNEPLPALLFGGKGLGLRHGSFFDFEAAPRCHNDLWLTVAQAYFGVDPLAVLPDDAFYKTGVQPIAGLWQAPA